MRWLRRRAGGASRSAVLAVTLGLAACGGGGHSAPAPAPGLLDAYAQPGSGEVFGEAEARHLLRRIAFAGSPSEVSRCVADGLPATVTRLLDAPPDTAAEAAADLFLRYPPQPSQHDVERSWLHLMVTTNAPVREKMALYWHQRLAVSGAGLDNTNSRWLKQYRDLLRTEGLGNYKTLLKELTHNGATLVFLSGLHSDKRHPNENYGRELWELFTLGVDVVYTQHDIQESARALTGWDSTLDVSTNTANLFWNAAAHDGDVKTILGETGSWGEDDVIEITLRRPEAAQFLARRLLEALCYASPEPEMVSQIAAAAVAGGWELKPLVRTIASSRAFFSAKARKNQVADPVIQMVGLARETEIPFENLDLLFFARKLNQVPLDPPSVQGWPQGLAWSGAQALLDRGAMADAIAGKRMLHDDLGFDTVPVFVDHLVPPPNAQGKITGAATVDHLAHRLEVALSPAERQALIDYMDTTPGPGGPVPAPFDGTDPAQVDLKVRGLLSAIAQHPDAMKN